MSELTMDRLRENLESLKMKNTLDILDNYLERAVSQKINIVEVLDHFFAEEALSKRAERMRNKFRCRVFPSRKPWRNLTLTFSPP